MGTWGAGILDDDFARDVYDAYLDAVRGGQPPAAAVAAVCARFARELADPDEEAVVWLALARAQRESGTVEADLLARAQAIVEGGQGLARWREAGPEALRQRKAALTRFVRELARPARPPRVARRAAPASAPFEVAVHHLAHPHGGERAGRRGANGGALRAAALAFRASRTAGPRGEDRGVRHRVAPPAHALSRGLPDRSRRGAAAARPEARDVGESLEDLSGPGLACERHSPHPGGGSTRPCVRSQYSRSSRHSPVSAKRSRNSPARVRGPSLVCRFAHHSTARRRLSAIDRPYRSSTPVCDAVTLLQ